MSNDYDSILKENEKSKLESSTNEDVSNKPNYVIIDIFVIVVIIAISYIIYYNTILSSKSIFLNDFKVVGDQYKNILKKLDFNYDISENCNLKGFININNGNNVNKLNYNINNNGDFLLKLYNDSLNVNYYSDKSGNLVKYSLIGDKYISIGGANVYDYIDESENLINNIKNIAKDKSIYKKSFYFDKEKPVVKVEISLNKDKINQIINNDNLKVVDDYNINISMVNGALSNEIKSIKVIVNNKTKDTRDVYSYDGEFIYHSSEDGLNEKISIKNDNGNFNLLYYKDDVLYSALTGTYNNGVYEYLYQVIEKKYTIKLTSDVNGNDYDYIFDVDINTDSKKYDMTIEIKGEYTKSETKIKEDVKDTILKKELNDSQKEVYKNLLNRVLGFDFLDVLVEDSN